LISVILIYKNSDINDGFEVKLPQALDIINSICSSFFLFLFV